MITRNCSLVLILALGPTGPALAQSEQALTEQRAKIDALDARIVALLKALRSEAPIRVHSGCR